MVKIEHPHTYDYNKDGFVPNICNTCGLVSGSHVGRDTITKQVFKFSGKKLKTLMFNVFNDFDVEKSSRKSIMKEVRRFKASTPQVLANRILEVTKRFEIGVDVYLLIEDIHSIVESRMY